MNNKKFYPKLTLRCPFEIVEVGDETVAVGIEEDGKESFHGVVKLENETTVFLFRKVMEGTTLPELVSACMKEYEGSEEEIGRKTVEFLDMLAENQMLLVSQTEGTHI